MVFAEERKP